MNRIIGLLWLISMLMAGRVTGLYSIALAAPGASSGSPAASFGQAAANQGVSFIASTEVLLQTVLAGGTKTTSQSSTITFLGAQFDLGRIAGLPGGSMIFVTNLQTGQTSGPALAATDSQFTPFAFGDEFRLEELAYRQNLASGHITLLLGRISPHFYLGGGFQTASWQCAFAAYACGDPGIFALDGQKPGYPSASWGGVLFFHPAPAVTFKAGVYEAEPIENTSQNNNGWPGADWGLDKSRGAYFPIQLDYVRNFAPRDLPFAYSLGGYFDNATFNDPALNTRGLPLALSGGQPSRHKTDSGIWLMGEQMLYRPDSFRRAGLTAFGSLDFATSPDQVFDRQIVVGLIDQGPLPRRPDDSLNLLAIDAALSSRSLENTNAISQRSGLGFTGARDEVVVELNYAVVLAPGITLRPYLQYTKNPDQLAAPERRFDEPYVASAGALLQVNFNRFLGLPFAG